MLFLKINSGWLSQKSKRRAKFNPEIHLTKYTLAEVTFGK